VLANVSGKTQMRPNDCAVDTGERVNVAGVLAQALDVDCGQRNCSRREGCFCPLFVTIQKFQ
jgi:hypothetical protein